MNKVGEIIMKVITNIILAFLTIAVIIMAYSFVVLNIAKKDYVNYFGYTMFEVATGSMANTINVNDLIIIKINDPYKVGDIITYKSGNDYITHRIIKIDEYTGVITAKGDANNIEDKSVNKNQVIGKVVKIMPKLGVWKKVIMTPKVMILMFLTLVLFNFAFSYTKIKNKKNAEKMIDINTNSKKEAPKSSNKIRFKFKAKEKQPFRK